jgi:hypothetical protein
LVSWPVIHPVSQPVSQSVDPCAPYNLFPYTQCPDFRCTSPLITRHSPRAYRDAYRTKRSTQLIWRTGNIAVLTEAVIDPRASYELVPKLADKHITQLPGLVQQFPCRHSLNQIRRPTVTGPGTASAQFFRGNNRTAQFYYEHVSNVVESETHINLKIDAYAMKRSWRRFCVRRKINHIYQGQRRQYTGNCACVYDVCSVKKKLKTKQILPTVLPT